MVEQRKWGQTPSFGPRQFLRHKLLAKELARAIKRGTVLDAGCGEGRMAELLSQKGFQVFGFDESSLSVCKAAERVPEASFWKGSLLKTALPDGNFDAVISGDVLEHLEHHDKAVQEMFRVLKPGGLAIVSVPADPEKWSIDDEWSGHLRRYTRNQLTGLFKAAGFAELNCRHWGWPIVWIYYRLIYVPLLKRGIRNPEKTAATRGFNESKTLNAIFSILCLPDMLCTKTPWGIGLVASFQKPAGK